MDTNTYLILDIIDLEISFCVNPMLCSAYNGYGGLLMLVMDIKLNEGLVIGNDILLLLRQSIIVKNAVQHGCKALNRC
jgi:hypothetical protein